MQNTFRISMRKGLLVAGVVLLAAIMSLGLVLQAGGRVEAAGLTSAEKSWLTTLREEEKLARDVYLVLYEKWQKPIFSNIAASEQRHMDAVKALLVKYGVGDPAAGKGIGEFSNPAFRDLFVRLTAQGSTSLTEALKVGVFIEETDIEDLNAALAVATRPDIKRVYGNLLQGSYNHLDAFEASLAKD